MSSAPPYYLKLAAIALASTPVIEGMLYLIRECIYISVDISRSLFIYPKLRKADLPFIGAKLALKQWIFR